MHRDKKQPGFSIIEILIGIVAIGLIGGLIFFAFNKGGDKNGNSERADRSESGGDYFKSCSGKGSVPMLHPPMDMNDVQVVLPVGTLAGAHVTPIDHLYFYPKDMKNRDAAPVYAMADGFIVDYQERTQNVDRGSAQQAEYQIHIQHNCDIVSYFDLMTSLDPSIAKQIKDSAGKDLRIAVKAGQVLGRVGAQSLDTGIYNYAMTLKGFVNPESYKAESWKLHTDQFFLYFKDPIKSAMLAKNPRTVEPRSGKIDYDIDGKLIGNWFEVGTNGYSGSDEWKARPGSGGKGYWNGHFSIAPDAINPSLTNISFGYYIDQARQFQAKKGSPDPATIGVESGLVKYEMVEYSQYPIGSMNVVAQENTQVIGTVLFQLTEARKLKIEAFPNKLANQVSGFTGAAKMYER